MSSNNESVNFRPAAAAERRPAERGAALATSLILLVLMGVIAASIVAVSQAEISVASQDLQQMRTFQCSQAHLEHMTNQFSDLFRKTNSPTTAQLNSVASSVPAGLASEGFSFVNPSLALDQPKLNAYRAISTSSTSLWPTVVLPPGSNAFSGLYASLVPFRMRSTCLFDATGTEVTLEREINSYLIPLFQFGMFSDGDIELHPGPAFTFNGRIHANGNIYLNGNVTLLNKVTTANEIVTDVIRNGSVRSGANVDVVVGQPGSQITVDLTQGSAEGGPNFGATDSTQRGYSPDSPTGTADPNWDANSTMPAAAGVPNRFAGQIVTRSTGATKLKLPLEIGGNPTREIIKRRMPNDDEPLSEGRYHTKARVRILIDDEGVATNASGIPAGRGVNLSAFKPVQLANGRALWRIDNNGNYIDTASTAVQQAGGSPCSNTAAPADTVRGVKTVTECSSSNRAIPGGAGIRGRVYVEIVDADGVERDVTQQILSMGMTVGEPNAIIHLQRPLWAAFLQGSRDRLGTASSLNQLVNLVNNSYLAADGEIRVASSGSSPNFRPQLDTLAGNGFLKLIEEDATAGRKPTPPAGTLSVTSTTPSERWNSIVPITLYNTREGWINSGLAKQQVYERGITHIVEINMRNLVRWLDGVYNSNLLSGTPAVSTNIAGEDGYIVYFSDRRGDTVRQEIDGTGTTLTTTNGMVDNEDIYGQNNTLDPGEDVIDHGIDTATGAAKKGSLQKDICELPDPAVFQTAVTVPASTEARFQRALGVAGWTNLHTANNSCGPANSPKYFRSAVRLFNGENLRTTGAAGKLSATKGLTFATENMLYIWGNYNTTGLNVAPVAPAASVNDCSTAGASCYQGNQVPASIVCDAIFPLSKTWFDASSALYPEGDLMRIGDALASSVTDETAVRAGVVAGNNLSAMSGTPDAGNLGDSRLSGGMHNFPRFLENWDRPASHRWNFTGSFVPLYRSTQAVGQWNYFDSYVIYGAPVRNWSFDGTFTDPSRLPPGTPTFQYIEPTGFRQVLGY